MSDAYVYIISTRKDGAPCKVGISSSPEARLSGLQTGSPEPLKLIDYYYFDTRQEAMRVERKFHDAHASQRAIGEWFNLDASEANYWLFCEVIVPELPR